MHPLLLRANISTSFLILPLKPWILSLSSRRTSSSPLSAFYQSPQTLLCTLSRRKCQLKPHRTTSKLTSRILCPPLMLCSRCPCLCMCQRKPVRLLGLPTRSYFNEDHILLTTTPALLAHQLILCFLRICPR